MNHITATQDREVRIRLTSHCNYKCFFCHEEGGCGRPENPTFDEIRPLLERLSAEGRRDFTLTGGEPLLNKPALLNALYWFAAHPDQPRVTLITNGSLMDDAVADALAACPSAKVHLSLHASDPKLYSKITGQARVTPSILVERFMHLTARGVGLKINAVLTRDLVQGHSRLAGLMAFASDVGATHVKLIELLVTEAHPELRDQYVSTEDADGMLQKHAKLVTWGRRTRTYQLVSGGPIIELTCCACRLGCSSCESFRADSFTGGDTYHPCFLSPCTYAVTPASLETVIETGRTFIQTMAKKYGSHSPSIITNPAA